MCKSYWTAWLELKCILLDAQMLVWKNRQPALGILMWWCTLWLFATKQLFRTAVELNFCNVSSLKTVHELCVKTWVSCLPKSILCVVGAFRWWCACQWCPKMRNRQRKVLTHNLGVRELCTNRKQNFLMTGFHSTVHTSRFYSGNLFRFFGI